MTRDRKRVKLSKIKVIKRKGNGKAKRKVLKAVSKSIVSNVFLGIK